MIQFCLHSALIIENKLDKTNAKISYEICLTASIYPPDEPFHKPLELQNQSHPNKILGRHSTKIDDFLAIIQPVFLLSFSQMINSSKAEIWLKHGQNFFYCVFLFLLLAWFQPYFSLEKIMITYRREDVTINVMCTQGMQLGSQYHGPYLNYPLKKNIHPP